MRTKGVFDVKYKICIDEEKSLHKEAKFNFKTYDPIGCRPINLVPNISKSNTKFVPLLECNLQNVVL